MYNTNRHPTPPGPGNGTVCKYTPLFFRPSQPDNSEMPPHRHRERDRPQQRRSTQGQGASELDDKNHHCRMTRKSILCCKSYKCLRTKTVWQCKDCGRGRKRRRQQTKPWLNRDNKNQKATETKGAASAVDANGDPNFNGEPRDSSDSDSEGFYSRSRSQSRSWSRSRSRSQSRSPTPHGYPAGNEPPVPCQPDCDCPDCSAT